MFRTLRFALFLTPFAGAAVAQEKGDLTLSKLMDIRHPSSPSFSPDGARLAFLKTRRN